jgi:hypothetical protein
MTIGRDDLILVMIPTSLWHEDLAAAAHARHAGGHPKN